MKKLLTIENLEIDNHSFSGIVYTSDEDTEGTYVYGDIAVEVAPRSREVFARAHQILCADSSITLNMVDEDSLNESINEHFAYASDYAEEEDHYYDE
jgi:hypothetical protein